MGDLNAKIGTKWMPNPHTAEQWYAPALLPGWMWSHSGQSTESYRKRSGSWGHSGRTVCMIVIIWVNFTALDLFTESLQQTSGWVWELRSLKPKDPPPSMTGRSLQWTQIYSSYTQLKWKTSSAHFVLYKTMTILQLTKSIHSSSKHTRKLQPKRSPKRRENTETKSLGKRIL